MDRHAHTPKGHSQAEVEASQAKARAKQLLVIYRLAALGVIAQPSGTSSINLGLRQAKELCDRLAPAPEEDPSVIEARAAWEGL